MKGLFRENIAEALLGLAVVLVAVWFVTFALDRTGGTAKANAIHVTGLFPNSSGVNVGTDVRVAGLKVGSVSGQTLDPQSFQVRLTMSIDPSVKLPSDSSAAITSEGLLGSTFVSLVPGGAPTPLKEGDQILDTQGAIDLMGLVGQFINRSPASGSAAGGASGEGSQSAAPKP